MKISLNVRHHIRDSAEWRFWVSRLAILLRDQPLANEGQCQPRWAESEGMGRRIGSSEGLNITLLEV